MRADSERWKDQTLRDGSLHAKRRAQQEDKGNIWRPSALT